MRLLRFLAVIFCLSGILTACSPIKEDIPTASPDDLYYEEEAEAPATEPQEMVIDAETGNLIPKN